jgi:four helix bundle protein
VATIEKFEDIKAWQEARVLTQRIYRLIRESKDFKRDRRLTDQLQAASVSIMSNIAEGFSRRSSREFEQFLFVAKGSAAEVQSLLYVALDQNYITDQQFSEQYQKTDEIARMLSGFITSLIRQDRNKKASRQ